LGERKAEAAVGAGLSLAALIAGGQRGWCEAGAQNDEANIFLWNAAFT
jgi:hypothetical protein